MAMNRVAVHSGPGEFHGKWCGFLEQEGVSVSRVNLPGRHAYEEIACCQGLMWHLPMAPSILQAAEPVLSPAEFVLGKKVFPNYATRWHFENKHAQKYLFDALGVAAPATVCLWDREEARDWIETGAQFPLVYKKARGAGSRNVSLVRSKEQALGIVKKAFSPRGVWHQGGYYAVRGKPLGKRAASLCGNIMLRVMDGAAHMLLGTMPRLPKRFWMPEKDAVLFQEFLPGNTHDTRITIIGDRAFGFRRWNRPKDFRASGGGSLDHDVKGIDEEMVSMAFRISEKGGFQSMAYDFLRTREGKPVICEISFAYQNTAVFQCPGHWDSRLNWKAGRMWPEQAHVQDFLERS